MTKSLKKVVIIIGPTAAGKTAAAMGAKDLLGGESKAQLISADSAMIYKGMDIGTAKPTNDELAAYPHELVSILDPKEIYSAADFVRDADIQIADALAKGKTPIIVAVKRIARLMKRRFNSMAALKEQELLSNRHDSAE